MYPATWYAETAQTVPVQPRLESDISAEVGIIGGGLAGLQIAWQLSQRGISVTLLESQRIAWGASGRNGGFVTPGFAGDIDEVEARYGQALAKRLYQYSKEGAETIRSHLHAFASDCLMGEGKYSVSRYPASKAMRKSAERLTRDFNDPVEYLDTSQLRSKIHTDRYFDGIFKPNGFQIHPLGYAHALASQILDAGGQIYEQSQALACLTVAGSSRRLVQTQSGSVKVNHLVLCTSGYDTGLYRPLSRAILPVATHVVVTEALNQDLLDIIATRAGIADTGNACDYYRLIDDNRLLWGGKITTATTQPKNLDAQMMAAMMDVFPTFGSLRLDYRWSGLMGYCRHRMPLILQPEKGLWVATAFGGHGLNTTAMAGNLIATAITEDDRRWQDFANFGLLWNGGVLGQVAVQGSYWWMQAKDQLLETKARRSLASTTV